VLEREKSGEKSGEKESDEHPVQEAEYVFPHDTAEDYYPNTSSSGSTINSSAEETTGSGITTTTAAENNNGKPVQEALNNLGGNKAPSLQEATSNGPAASEAASNSGGITTEEDSNSSTAATPQQQQRSLQPSLHDFLWLRSSRPIAVNTVHERTVAIYWAQKAFRKRYLNDNNPNYSTHQDDIGENTSNSNPHNNDKDWRTRNRRTLNILPPNSQGLGVGAWEGAFLQKAFPASFSRLLAQKSNYASSYLGGGSLFGGGISFTTMREKQLQLEKELKLAQMQVQKLKKNLSLSQKKCSPNNNSSKKSKFSGSSQRSVKKAHHRRAMNKKMKGPPNADSKSNSNTNVVVGSSSGPKVSLVQRGFYDNNIEDSTMVDDNNEQPDSINELEEQAELRMTGSTSLAQEPDSYDESRNYYGDVGPENFGTSRSNVVTLATS